MASSQFPYRSISLPSRLHPTGFEAELTRRKSSSFSKEVPVTSQAIQSALVELDWDGQYSCGRKRRSNREGIIVDVDSFTRRLRRPRMETQDEINQRMRSVGLAVKEALLARGELYFTDQEFPPSERSLFVEPENPRTKLQRTGHKPYNSIEKIGKSPSSEHSLVLNHEEKGKSVEDSLDLSIELLDSCSSLKDLAQMIRENVHSLQSAIRRKGLDIHNDIISYLCFRKKMNKGKANSLLKLKILENKNGQLGGDACGLNIAIFRWSLLLFSPPAIARSNGWNLVSRMMSTKSAAGNKDLWRSGEVGCVDFALDRLQQRSRSGISTVSDVQMVQKNLQNLDTCMEGIEKGLDKLFRQLIRSRVALLNVLADH